MKKENIEKILQDAWLGINVEEDELFNPMDFLFYDQDKDKMIERIAWLMMRPEYFSFVCKYVLNIEISPFQSLILSLRLRIAFISVGLLPLKLAPFLHAFTYISYISSFDLLRASAFDINCFVVPLVSQEPSCINHSV